MKSRRNARVPGHAHRESSMIRYSSVLVLLLCTAVFLGCVRSRSEYGLILRNQTSGTLTDVQATLGDYTTIKLRLIPGAEVSFGDVASVKPKNVQVLWTAADGRRFRSSEPVGLLPTRCFRGYIITSIGPERMQLTYETIKERYRDSRSR